MISQLFMRLCFKWSSWILVGFLIFYIYVVALYFLYSNQERVERYAMSDNEHPVHDHGGGGSILPDTR